MQTLLPVAQPEANINSPGTGNSKRKGINFTELNLKIMNLKDKLTKCVHPNRKPSQITNKTVFKTKLSVCVQLFILYNM